MLYATSFITVYYLIIHVWMQNASISKYDLCTYSSYVYAYKYICSALENQSAALGITGRAGSYTPAATFDMVIILQ